MPVVTALEGVRGGRIAVFVDGERALVASQALVARWRLFVDRTLSDEDLAQLRNESGREAALADAHRLLGHRSRSRRELADRLAARGYPPEVVDPILLGLQGAGHLDDRAFARAFATDKRNLSGWGRERIAEGLARAGVAPGIIAEALDPEDEADEIRRAEALLLRGGTAAPPLEAARKRAFDRLRRRGFSSRVAYAAVLHWAARSTPATGEAVPPRDP